MLTTDLYPYQKPALDKFIERGNMLLAWEMGLGKTLCAVAAAETLRASSTITTTIIVAPASLLYQWAEEIAKHTDCLTIQKKMKKQTFVLPDEHYVQVVDGTAEQRKKQFYRAYENHPPYILMSYGTVVSSARWVRRLKAEFMVIDEATNIKSFDANRSKAIKRLRPPYRLALTGTPIENRPDEVFSIMQWVDEDVLGEWDLFDHTFIERDKYDTVVAHKNLSLFHRKMSECMSRRKRTDPDVAPYLPDVDTREWYVECDGGARAAYAAIATDLLRALLSVRGGGSVDLASYYGGSGADDATPLGRVMSRQLALELLLDHPDLVINSALDYQEAEIQRLQGVEKSQWPGSQYCYEVWNNGILDGCTESAKLKRLVRETKSILEHEGSKILIFSRFKYMLSIIEDALGVQCVQYHGDLSPARKASAVRLFTDSPDIQVFLSSHAGAYGTNMFMANWLINYDLPWSSGRADQINGRHQRAASEFDLVHVRNMITRGTVEERKLEMLEYKRSLADAIIDGKVDATGRIENDLDTLASWLEEYV
jgi:SNF2 family DNA or RNA helicase